MEAENARYQRLKKRTYQTSGLHDDGLDDEEFVQDPRKALTKVGKTYDTEEEKEAKKADFFGYAIEPFHMKEEKMRGKITKEGFYQFDKSKDKLYRDPWLDSIDDNPNGVSIFKPKNEEGGDAPVEESEDAIQAKKNKIIEEMEVTKGYSKEDILNMKKELYDLLIQGESGGQALKRLRPVQSKTQVKTTQKNVRKKLKTEQSSEIQDEDKAKNSKSEEETKKQQIFNRVIELCDSLTSCGYVDVYTDTKEELQAEIRSGERELNPPPPRAPVIQSHPQYQIPQPVLEKVEVPVKPAENTNLLEDLEEDFKD